MSKIQGVVHSTSLSASAPQQPSAQVTYKETPDIHVVTKKSSYTELGRQLTGLVKEVDPNSWLKCPTTREMEKFLRTPCRFARDREPPE